jgi:hypothetical protein
LSWKQLCRRKYVERGPTQCGQHIAALIVILYNIADALGLSLVHANKTLARLRCLGMYTQPNGTLTRTNPRAPEASHSISSRSWRAGP